MHEYNSILKMEEDHWKIRYRINWLNEGDANTKFFHLSVLNRRRKNKISYFKDNSGNWIMDHNAIVSHTVTFFQNMYTSAHSYTHL